MMTGEPSGQDVSQRIRNAIKSKLVDIGCYVDDELPDYVMVMIANKKSKDQMKADLELFLGEYCGGFCDWLHQVLDHLQRFAREGKHKIDIFEEKHKSSKTKEKSDHRSKDKERGAIASSGSGDEVAFHLDIDEKREFEETETKDNSDSKRKESRRSRSRSPLKKIEERTKKKLRERVDEVTKEVKRKEASRTSGGGRSEPATGNSRKRIEIDCGRGSKTTSSTTSHTASRHNRSPERNRSSGSLSASRRPKAPSPVPARRQSPQRSHLREAERKEREKNREKTDSRRSREERRPRRDDEEKKEKATTIQISSRPAKTQEVRDPPKRSPEAIRIERTIENHQEKSHRPSSVGKNRLTSTIGAVVTNDASESECEDETKYDPSRPQLKSVATVAPRKRLIVDKNHLEKNKILAKALQDANRSTSAPAAKQQHEQSTGCRSSEDRGGPVKKRIHDRLGAYVTDAIAARVAAVKRRREMPPSLGDDDDDDDENMAESNDRRAVAEDGENVGGGLQPRIIVTMKRIPDDLNTTALDADQEVEMEDLRLSLIRNSNALNAVPKEQASIQDDISTVQPLATAHEHDKVTSIDASTNSGAPPRKKMIVTNKNGVQVAPKKADAPRSSESNSLSSQGNTTVVKAPAAAPVASSETKQSDFDDDKDVIIRNGMIVKPSPLLAACRLNVNAALTGNKIPSEKTTPAKDPKTQSNQALQPVTVTRTKTKSEIAEKIPLQSLDDLVPKTTLTSATDIGASLFNLRGRQRCRFDPVCTNPVCRFAHPGQLCSSFPLCGFSAASCSFRHPACKFNLNCTNPTCLYAHTEDTFRAIETGTPAACKFFPNCTNSACPFFHPSIPCKFGLRCQAQGCPFVHPEKAAVAKLRWVANN